MLVNIKKNDIFQLK